MSEQKKPSAAAVRVQKNFLAAACDDGYRRNLEILVDAEIQELIEALVAVTPEHRKRGACWCCESRNIKDYGHESGCRMAKAALAHAKGDA